MIKCKRFISAPNDHFVGYADLWVSSLRATVCGCKMYQKDGRRWVNPPQEKYEKDGEVKFKNVIHFDEKELVTHFSDSAKKAIDEWCREQEAKKQDEPAGIVEEDEDLPF